MRAYVLHVGTMFDVRLLCDGNGQVDAGAVIGVAADPIRAVMGGGGGAVVGPWIKECVCACDALRYKPAVLQRRCACVRVTSRYYYGVAGIIAAWTRVAVK